MKKSSSTTLEGDVSATESPARHPIFQLVRPAVVVGCLSLLLIGLDFLINHHPALYYVHIGPRFVLHDPHAPAGDDCERQNDEIKWPCAFPRPSLGWATHVS